ncbi:site-specific integrase [Paenibacillus sp. FSL H7-0350]|uniref:site-specific integrase n=1 Tax=Paenibacillus sp. FSL H7-0350 TaxID=2975345 RepID=UPI00315901AD
MPWYEDEKTKTYYFKVNYKEDGKYKQVLRRGFKTKKEVKAAMAEAEDQINKKKFIQKSNKSFGDFLTSYLNDKKMNVKSSTWKMYASLVNNHVIPSLGMKNIQSITPRNLQDFYNELHEKGSLSDENIQKCHTLINDAMKQAKAWKEIGDNPAELVKRPVARKKEMQVWTLEESHRFLDAAKDDRYYIVSLLALTTGMRQGEILGLRWKDVDFENKIISITQILSHDGKELQAGAKTVSGSRPIRIDNHTLEILEKHRRKMKEEKMIRRDVYQDLDLVVATSLGNPVSLRNINRSFSRIVENLNTHVQKSNGLRGAARQQDPLKKIRFHDLRHSHVTFLIKNRETPQAIAERLGWSDTRMIDNYAHITPDIQEDTADSFGKSFYKGG